MKSRPTSGAAYNVWCQRCGKYLPLVGQGVVASHDVKGNLRPDRKGKLCLVSGMTIMEALDDADAVAKKKRGKK